MNEKQKQIAQRIAEGLGEKKIDYYFNESRKSFVMYFNVAQSKGRIMMRFRLEEKGILFLTYIPNSTDCNDYREMKKAVALVHKCNSSVQKGCCLVDVTTGEFLYRDFLDCSKRIPAKEEIDRIQQQSLLFAEALYKKLQKIR